MTEGTRVAAIDNGPFLVSGPPLLTDAAGGEFPGGRKTVALCRCGASRKRPLCDGTRRSGSKRAVTG